MLRIIDFDRIGRKVPLLVDLKPSGDNYMEDLHRVGELDNPTVYFMLIDCLGWWSTHSSQTVTSSTTSLCSHYHWANFGRRTRPVNDHIPADHCMALR